MPLDLSREIVARWNDTDPKYVPLLKEGGVTAVVSPGPNEAFAKACKESGIQSLAESQIKFTTLEELPKTDPRGLVALQHGQWPGVTRPPNVRGRGDETASASNLPWVDANGFWIAYLRAMFPNRPPLLGYLPDEKAGVKPDRMLPFDSLELALTEAWVSGGNYVLALEPRYREALLKDEPKAKDAWKNLGRAARWLQRNIALFRQRVDPTITNLVEESEMTAEICNLMFRQNASPAVTRFDAPPPPDPRCLALVAAEIKTPAPALRNRILAHALAGASVITSGPPEKAWWKDSRMKLTKSQEDRDFFAYGKGQVVAYKSEIGDPYEFGLDVIDIVTQRRRAIRLWNGPSMIALATDAPKSGPASGKALAIAVSYGRGRGEVQMRYQGVYGSATLLTPEAEPKTLKAVKRGTMTEIFLQDISHLAVIVFS